MKASLRIGRIAGVEVGVHWSVLFIVVILAWSLGGTLLPDGAPGYAGWEYWVVASATALVFAGSILAHELSHSVVANRDGVPVDSIVLWLFGGVAKLRSNARTARSELRIALAGPAMSLLIGAVGIGAAVALHAAGDFDLVTTALAWLGWINIVVALFNLMPGAPLDGGRVLTAMLWARSRDEQAARRWSANVGRILGQVLIGLGVLQFAFVGGGGLWTALVGWLIMSMARMELIQSEMRDVFAGVRVGDVTTPDPFTLVSSFPVIDTEGRPLGLITLKRITELKPQLWNSTPLSAIAVPTGELVVAHSEDALIDVLEAKQDPNARILVISGGRVAGIVSPTDVARAFEQLSLVHRRGNAAAVPWPPLPPPAPGQRPKRSRQRY